MPIQETQDPAQPTAFASDIQEDFLVFFASRDDTGMLWCPDCRAVDGLVQGVFGPKDGPSALIVYVGQRAEWKDPTNPFRGAPWKINSIPTIVRVRDGTRLVVEEIDDQSIFSLVQA